MKVLILSHFNPWYGPKIFLKAPKTNIDEDLNSIPSLMDLYEKGFFIHSFKNFKSANYLFEIQSEYGRGNSELLLISIIIEKKNDVNLNLSEDLLKRFSEELMQVQDAYKSFYMDSDVYQGDPHKYEEVKDLFFTFYEYFPKESILLKRPEANIFVYGLSHAGKTTIIKNLQNSITDNPLPTTNVNISKILINNISIVTYDAPGQSNLKELWIPYLNNQNGLVFVLDIEDKDKFSEAKKTLYDIAQIPKLKDLPLMILLNKVDLAKPDKELLTDELELQKLQDRVIKCFYTSGLTGEGLSKAFNWLSLQLGESMKESNLIDIGIIFSRWHEEDGVKIVSVYPKDELIDPDILAIRCFSISQFVFGEESFEKVSFILPFTHLNANAAIHFDSILYENVRGGELPLSLIVFFNDKIPRAIIQQLTDFIFQEFDVIKTHFSDKGKVRNDLIRIHKQILKKVRSYRPTVKALRLAELKYQSLFKAARDAILILDKTTGIIIDANEQLKKLLLMEFEDIIGMHISQINLSEEYDEITGKIMKQINKENIPPINIFVENSNKKRIPVEVNANEINIGGQSVIQCIIRDITERQRSEAAIKEALEKYKKAYNSANFYKELFTHDMNSILNNIQSSIELFSLYVNNPYKLAEIKDISEIIRDQVIRGATLVKNVREISKIEDTNLKLKKVQLEEILNKSIKSVYKKFPKKNIDIEINSAKYNYKILANDYLFSAFENIIINAIKYNENQRVIVQIMIRKINQIEKDYIQLEFVDNGIGIPDERKELLFKGGYKREKGGRGMDVGLSLAKNVIEAINGEIWVENRDDLDYTKGCNFVILIPKFS
ncbi:MAG: PAS domain S-box protein [Candidatus Lokiarchaeota archaeon]|nr:PAS domain S-box protein [Candidatus Lokiarchaeota archaeon]MBD3202008.1 PAS domain S-box protein [Candidatus Lokiarchaeota archaeon]